MGQQGVKTVLAQGDAPVAARLPRRQLDEVGHGAVLSEERPHLVARERLDRRFEPAIDPIGRPLIRHDGGRPEQAIGDRYQVERGGIFRRLGGEIRMEPVSKRGEGLARRAQRHSLRLKRRPRRRGRRSRWIGPGRRYRPRRRGGRCRWGRDVVLCVSRRREQHRKDHDGQDAGDQHSSLLGGCERAARPIQVSHRPPRSRARGWRCLRGDRVRDRDDPVLQNALAQRSNQRGTGRLDQPRASARPRARCGVSGAARRPGRPRAPPAGPSAAGSDHGGHRPKEHRGRPPPHPELPRGAASPGRRAGLIEQAVAAGRPQGRGCSCPSEDANARSSSVRAWGPKSTGSPAGSVRPSSESAFGS